MSEESGGNLAPETGASAGVAGEARNGLASQLHRAETGASAGVAGEARNGLASEPHRAPLMRVVAGSPTEDELAAAQSVLAAVLVEQAARGVEPLTAPVDLWRRSARAMRGHIAPGPGAWTASRRLRGC